jgi:molybdate transport system substrate-binding protein
VYNGGFAQRQGPIGEDGAPWRPARGGAGLSRRFALAFAWMALAAVAAPAAAEAVVLSGGAVEPGILAAAEAFRRSSGVEVAVDFATAPAIRSRLRDSPAAADILVVPLALAQELARAGDVSAEGGVPVGRVGVGVAVRQGADQPDIRSAESFRREVLSADSLVWNTASTGLYLDALFERMGLAESVRARVSRLPTGDAVMERLRHGEGRQIGFGAVTEILLHRDKGVVLVGPLPPELQNSTPYVAVPTVSRGAASADAARFLAFLRSPQGLAPFRTAGIGE